MEEFITKTLSLGALFLTILIISFLISLITKNSDFYSSILKKWGIQFIFILTLFSTIMSLVLTHAFDMIPCDLCWYQRIFMYPVVLISGFAWYKKDYRNGAIYSLLLSVFGFIFALYNYLLQVSEPLKNSDTFCSPDSLVDCSIPEFVHFGFVNFPYLSMVGFVLVIISSFYAARKK